MLVDQEWQDVESGSVGARRRKVGERGRSRSGGTGGSRSGRAVGVGVDVNTDATPGSDGVVGLIRFGGGWPAVHEYSAAFRLPRTARDCCCCGGEVEKQG